MHIENFEIQNIKRCIKFETENYICPVELFSIINPVLTSIFKQYYFSYDASQIH
jgi:hypothetical protein